jgi:predicted nucleotidyltransferase
MERGAIVDESRFGIPLRVWSQMEEVFRGHPAVVKAMLYGSRAKGNYRDNSDIDLALSGEGLTLTDQFRLETALDDLLLPWRIDLCRYEAVREPSLRDEIDRWGVEVYRKEEV